MSAEYGKVIAGNEETVRRSCEQMASQPVDMEMIEDDAPVQRLQTTLACPASVAGPGTFFRRATRTLVFEPFDGEGWWFDRTDLPDTLPTRVSVRNVWTTVRNIVLRSGSPHNYVRMVEHIVALRTGLGLDNVMIRLASGDPPLFDHGSMDLVEAVEKGGIVAQSRPAKFCTVKEPVTAAGPNGSFLTFLPCKGNDRSLDIDCAIDFNNAIGKQRIRFKVNKKTFHHGVIARTNTTRTMAFYYKTIGILFADMRNAGYTPGNILIAGKKSYVNEPRLLHNGKALEAVWHRAALDLLSAVALIDTGRFAGKIISYKSGHALDVTSVLMIYRRNLLEELPPA